MGIGQYARCTGHIRFAFGSHHVDNSNANGPKPDVQCDWAERDHSGSKIEFGNLDK